jgi:ribosomal protein S12 methylthiotransferase accessory factor YcaO
MPLSEHEQRLLDEIEQALYAEDPKFASSVRSARPRSRVRMMLALSTIGVILGLAVVLVGLTANLIVVGVLGFVLIVGSCVAAASALRGPRQSTAAAISSSSTSVNRQNNLRTKMEDRMRRRFEEN